MDTRGTQCKSPGVDTTLSLTPFSGTTRSARGSLSSAFDPLHLFRLESGRIASIASSLARNAPNGVIETRELPPGETRRGTLEFVEGEARDTLLRLLYGDQQQFKSGRGTFSVSPSGARLMAIAGSNSIAVGRSHWDSGDFYEVELSPLAMRPLYVPDAKADKKLIDCAAVTDDEAWLLSARALRRFENTTQGWRETTSLRLTDGTELAVGNVGDVTVGLVLCIDRAAGSTKTLAVTLRAGKFVKLGEVLDAVQEVRVEAGHALVARTNTVGERNLLGEPTHSTWYAIELADALVVGGAKPSGKKRAAPQSELHPLGKATLDVLDRTATPVPRVPDELGGSRRALAWFGPQMHGPRRAAVLDPEGSLHVVDDASHLIVKTPTYRDLGDATTAGYLGTPARGFALSPSARRVWLIAGHDLFERELPAVTGEATLDASDWKRLRLEGGATWGPEAVAALDEEHLVVKSDKSMDLIVRHGDALRPLQRIAVADIATAVVGFGSYAGILAITTPSVLTLYALRSGKLAKLHVLALPTNRFLKNRRALAVFTADGRLWIDAGTPAEVMVRP